MLPEGEVLALRPPALADLSALPRDRWRVHHTNRPDRDAWAAAGYRLEDEPGPAAVAVVFVPRSKALARGLVARAAALAPLVLVDGRREDGVDSLWRELRARRPAAEGLAQGHGRLVWFAGGAGFEDWALPGPLRGPDGLWTQAGVFAAEGPDRGSALLAAALPARLPARMADLGAGIGVLSRAVLAREGVVALDLVEAERLALDCARLNVADPRARLRWEDATAAPLGPYDGIVMNPPFHAGARAAEPGLGRAFIAAAARALAPRGEIWMVANRHLPYEAALAESFRAWEEVGGDAGFKLLHAREPRAAKGAARRVVRARRCRASRRIGRRARLEARRLPGAERLAPLDQAVELALLRGEVDGDGALDVPQLGAVAELAVGGAVVALELAEDAADADLLLLLDGVAAGEIALRLADQGVDRPGPAQDVVDAGLARGLAGGEAQGGKGQAGDDAHGDLLCNLPFPVEIARCPRAGKGARAAIG